MSDTNQSRQAQPEPQIANGWTVREALAMDAHISAKVASDPYRAEVPNSSYRQAERASDATHPMHDARREAQANAYVSQAQRDAARLQTPAAPRQAEAQASQRQQQARQPSQDLTR